MSKYADIIERLENATGPSAELSTAALEAAGLYVLEKRGRDQKAWLYPLHDGYRSDPAFFGGSRALHVTASIDAAIALVERMLPDMNNSTIKTGNGEYAAYIWGSTTPFTREWRAEGVKSTRAIAILLALFRALEAKEREA